MKGQQEKNFTFNPLTTEPQVILLLLENDNLGIIN